MHLIVVAVTVMLVAVGGSVASRMSGASSWWRGSLAVCGVLLVLTATNPLGHDALEALTSDDRRVARDALGSAAGCDGWLSRVADVEPTGARGLSSGFTYRCEWTLLGWPGFTGEAQCGDGTWYVPGWREVVFTSKPCGGASVGR